MHAADQFALEFEDEKLAFELKLRDQWDRRQAADAHNWTDEAMAMIWFLGMNDWEWWRSLPNYTREQVINSYRFEQTLLSWQPERGKIRTYREACPGISKEVFEDRRLWAENMAQQLAADWSANRAPSVFTFDKGIAAMVTCRLGRRVEAVKPSLFDDQ